MSPDTTTARDDDTADASVADAAAPLDSLLVDAALGPMRRFTPDSSTAA